MHRARVTGYHHLDGILQCSMKESILEQKWLRVNDVNVGEMVKVSCILYALACLLIFYRELS